MKIFTYLVAIGLLHGCAVSQEKGDLKSQKEAALGVTVISNHPDIINTYVQPNSNQNMLCLEPDPDVVSTFSGSLSLGDTVAGNEDKISASDGSSAVSMGGLSPMVLLSRELMYRACELSMNSNADGDQQLIIYKLFLNTLENLNTNTSDSGTASSAPKQ